MSVIKNLQFSWKNDLLLDIDYWDLPDNGISALMGPSGSGKSSLLRCLIGLEECDGEWIYQDKNLMNLSVPQKNFAVLFQSLDLFPHMTAQQNIMFSAESRNINKSDTKKDFNKLVYSLDLEECLSRKASELSGGEAQRVSMARALICRPDRLFLDEPFSSLDANLKKQARELVKRIIKEFEIPTLMITHDPEDVSVLADYKFKLKNKKIMAFDKELKI